MQHDYRVELDAYHGPLDLLLFLVKRHEIDLNDIPVARLTEQYLEHLKLIQQIDVDLAGEFLVMAATLLEIKSALLVPQPAGADPAGDMQTDGLSVADPRFELVQQLLAYKRFKEAASDLDGLRGDWEQRFARTPPRGGEPAARKTLVDYEHDYEHEHEETSGEIEIDLEDVHVLDLCQAFARILESIGKPSRHEVVYDDTPIALHAEDIVDRLQRDGAMSLQQIFQGRQNRGEMIGLFLATLELVRQRRVRVVQDAQGGDIRLELQPADEQGGASLDKPADWRDPVTGQVQYDWPSEEDRVRADRRARLRATRTARGEFGEPAEDDIVDTAEEGELPAATETEVK